MVVSFAPDGSIEFAVSYSHSGGDLLTHAQEIPSPGSKRRTTSAARMASKALRVAPEGLDKGEAISTGFATDTITSTDTIVVDSVDQRTSRRANAKAS